MTCARRLTVHALLAALVVASSGCGTPPTGFVRDDAGPADAARGMDAADARADAGPPPDAGPVDAPRPDVQLDPDAACTSVTAMATVERQPVDIVWMVDNSVSMAPAIDQVIAGLNGFASLVGSRGLDYRVVMLSLRSRTRMITVRGSARYAVCIPRPLAGDDNCGNSARFLHSSVDVLSTQPLEQILGTLGQTAGYREGEARGGEPWRAFLRANATKTFVVVTDDNARLSADQFERFPGGMNPFNSLTLPPGILDPSWSGLFNGYTFDAIYGWGSATDPSVRCTFSDGTRPASSGPTYTTLVTRTRGVRAQLCAGASTWGPFFNSVATAVEQTSRVACDVAVPRPPDGSALDPTRVNVAITRNGARTLLGRVRSMAACGAAGGWYFDDDANPRRVFLCPASCERAQTDLRGGGLEVQFGCVSIPG